MGLAIVLLLTEGILAAMAVAAVVGIFVGAAALRKTWTAFPLSALVVLLYFWSLFPTRGIHERLCATRAGEQIYGKVNATSYLMVGEGRDDHHFVGMRTVLEDLLDRRVAFVEVVKEFGHNNSEVQFSLFPGARAYPEGSAFRLHIAKQGAPECAVGSDEARRSKHFFKDRLKDDECIALTPIAKPTSRYRVQLVDAKPVWYAPEIRQLGLWVVDAQENRMLGEYSVFEQFARPLVIVLRGDKGMTCPSRKSGAPRDVFYAMQKTHRRVLFGAP